MTKSLRKRHLQFWTALLVLLPAGIISARLLTPAPPVDALLQPAGAMMLPIIAHSAEKENYNVYVRKSNDSTFQLHWVNKNILTVPTATIYLVPQSSNTVKNGQLIGRIEARGTYLFPLKSDIVHEHLVVYDFIHQQIIDTVNFKQ